MAVRGMSLGRRVARLLLPAAFGLGSGAALPAQAVAGRVTDARGGAPLARASVALLDSAGAHVAGAFTDGEGRYAVRAPSPGRYALLVRRPGYAPGGSDSLLTVERAATVQRNVALAPVPEVATLAPVRVGARRRSARERTVLGVDLRSTPGDLVTPSEVAAIAPTASGVLDVLWQRRLVGFRTDGDLCLKPAGGAARRGATSLRSPDDAPLDDAGPERSTRACLPLYIDEVLLARPGDPPDLYEAALASVRPAEVDWIFVPRGGALPPGLYIYTKRPVPPRPER